MPQNKKVLSKVHTLSFIFIFCLSCKINGNYYIPEEDEAVITFYSGQVNILEKEDWRPVYLAEILKKDTVIQVLEDSYCEIQIGEKACVRIEENSLLKINSLYDKKIGASIELGLQKGILLCKVEKLLPDESFSVTTPASVAEVRGTRFLLQTEEGQETHLAVTEGSVKIKPTVNMKDLASCSRDGKTSAVIGEIDEAFPVVQTGEEIIINREEILNSQNSYKDIKAMLESGKDPDTKFIEELEENGRELTLYGIKSVIAEPELPALEILAGLELRKQETSPAMTPISVKGPENSSIYLDGKFAGTADFQGLVPLNRPAPVLIKKPGYYQMETIITPENPQKNEYRFELNKIPDKNISVSTIPASAVITVDGKEYGTGNYQGIMKNGEDSVIKVSAPGYNDKWVVVKFDENTRENISITLDKSIIREYRPSYSKIIGLAYKNGILIYSDYDGLICAVKGSKERLWAVATVNTPIEASVPILIDDLVAFSGLNELVLVNVVNGAVQYRKTLSQGEQHIFGRHPVEFESYIAYPTNTGLQLLKRNGEKVKEISIPDGTRMTPAAYKGNLYIAGQNGIVHIFNTAGEETGIIKTGTERPIALSMSIQGNYGYFSDKNGKIVCLDLSRNSVVWEKSISRNESIPISDNILVSGERLYAFSRGKLFVLSARDGSLIYGTDDSYSAPPLYKDGLLYIGGEDKILHVLKADTGKEIFVYNIMEKVTTLPLFADGKIFIGTEKGSIFEIKPLEIPAVLMY